MSPSALRSGLLLAALLVGAASPAAQPTTTAPPAPASAGVFAWTASGDPARYAACVSRFQVVGLPVERAGAGTTDHIAICRRGYALSFNQTTRNPDWVIERLVPSNVQGSAHRRDNFQADPLVPDGPTPDDYNKSGKDRGHQAPAGDEAGDQTLMDETFYMSNMSPQVGVGFNRNEWKYLEESVRAAIACGGHSDVVVITGPVYGKTLGKIGPAGRSITVPAAYFKIAYDVGSGRAEGFELPNKALAKTAVAAFVVSISTIENATGIEFFAGLPQRNRTEIESSKGEPWGHGESCTATGQD